MRIFGVALGAAVLSLLPATPALAVQATLTDDTYVSVAARTTNYGAADSLLVQGGTGRTSTYLRFSLSSLPGGTRGSDVARAVLRLWVSTVAAGGMFDVHTVRGGWTEGAITAANAPPQGRDEVGGVPVTPRDRHSWIVVDLTDLVRDWLDRALENNGIVLLPGGGISVAFDSKENTQTSHEPRLEIALRGSGAQGPPGPAGTAGPAGPPGPRGPAGPPGPAGAAGSAGPAGPPGPGGAAPPTGAPGAPPRMAAPGLGGLQEFRSGGVWVAPPGVTRVLVEAWGAGGGGGAGSPGGTGGGGGGGGAYQRAIVAVTPGATYEVVLGGGGSAGTTGPGGDGSGTQLRPPGGMALLGARGGRGGTAGADDGRPAQGGAGGIGDPALGLARDGAAGGAGAVCRGAALNPSQCIAPGTGGPGGAPVRGTVDPPRPSAAGGNGGGGGQPGQAGAPGYAILTW